MRKKLIKKTGFVFLAIYIFTICIGIGGVILSTYTAKPGSLFFAPKVIAEDFRIEQFRNNIREADFYNSILEDRVEAFRAFGDSNICTRLLLTENSILLQHSRLNNALGQIDTTDTGDILKDTIEILKSYETSDSSCKVRNELIVAQDIYRFLYIKSFEHNSKPEGLIEFQDSKIATNEENLDTIQTELKSYSFESQTHLNRVTDTLLNALHFHEESIKALSEDDLLGSYVLSLMTNDLISQVNASIEDPDVMPDVMLRDHIRFICLVIEDPSCSAENITSTFNSIKSISGQTKRIETNQKIFVDYITLL